MSKAAPLRSSALDSRLLETLDNSNEEGMDLRIDDEKNIAFEELDEREFKCPKCRSSKKFFVKKQSPA